MSGLRIAITGLDTFVGQRLVRRLLERDDAPVIVGLDVRPPLRLIGRMEFHEIDLTDPVADARLAEVLRSERVDVLVHLAFRRFPTPDIEYDHDLETLGSLQVMSACAAGKVKRLVVQSSTMVYGPRRDNPNFLDESKPLHGHRDAHCVRNRVEMEQALADWSVRHPEIQTTLLRHCWVMGPSYYDRVVQFFERDTLPVVLGYDPLLQFLHESDLVDVFERATLEPHPGTFNVVGDGVLPLSTLIALAGKRPLPLPRALLYRGAWLSEHGESGDAPAGFYDYLRYLWVADGARGWAEFGQPIYSTREAWIAFIGSRKMRHYR